MTLHARTVPVDDPGELIPRLPSPDGVAWVRHGHGLVGWGETLRVELGTGPDRFRRAAGALAGAKVDDQVGLPGTGLVGFVAGTFDENDPGSVLIVPRVVLGRAEGHAWLTTAAEGTPPPPADVPAKHALPMGTRLRYAGASMPELQWLEAVDAATKTLQAGGTLAKIVLARDLVAWTDTAFDPRLLARRLAARFDDCYTFTVDGLVGATPELLVRRQGRQVQALPLAGSARRDPAPDVDAALGAELLTSAKNQAEHRRAAESVVDALADVTTHLDADDEPWLLRLANIQHLATLVQGDLASTSTTVMDLVTRLNPTAAVCGTPRHEALAEIRRLELFSRGRYAGPVGWVDQHGDGEFGIALRCAQVNGSRARLFAGAGIMADSLPEAELEETRIKFHAMQSAFGN